LNLYVDAAVYSGFDCFELQVRRNDVRLVVDWGSDGLFVHDGAARNEVGTNEVTLDTWQEWTFDIDFSTPASATVDIYRDGSLLASDVDCSYEGSYANGFVALAQYGYATANQISYVDWIKVGDAFYNHTLAMADGAHSQSADAPVLTQVHSLAMQEAAHALTSDAIALTQVHTLVVADSLNSHTAEALALTQVHTLVVNDALHSHTVESLVLTCLYNLIIQNSVHTLTSYRQDWERVNPPTYWNGEISNKPLKRYGMRLLDSTHYKKPRHKRKQYLMIT
jgi:hypothetical protein